MKLAEVLAIVLLLAVLVVLMKYSSQSFRDCVGQALPMGYCSMKELTKDNQ